MVVLAILSIRVPYVQKYVVKRYLKQCFSGVYVDTVSVGFSAAKVRKLAFSFKNIDFKVSDFDVTWSLRDLIFLRELKIKDMSANGVFINCIKSEAATKTKFKLPINQKEAYENLQKRLEILGAAINFVKSSKFSMKTTIDHMKISGLLGINEFLIADFTLDGTGFAPLNAAIVNIKSDVAIGVSTPARLSFDGRAKIFQSQSTSIDDIDFNCDCELFNPAEQYKKIFNITSFYKVTPSENSYRLRIESNQSNEVICNAEIKHQKDQQKLFIECESFLDMTAFDASVLPPLTLNTRCSGEFEFQNWSGLLKGNCECILGTKIIKTYFPSLKSILSISGGIALKMTNGTLAINTMDAICDNEDHSWKIALSSTNPIIIWNKDAGYLAPKNIFNSGKNLCRITVEKFNPKVFSTTKKMLKFDTAISGQFDISSADGCWRIKSSEKSPLQLSDLTVTQISKKHIEKINISGQAALIFGNTTQLMFNDVAINGINGDTIVAGAISLSFDNNKRLNMLDCNAVCYLNQLAQIPWFATEIPIKSGVCSGRVNFTQTLTSVAAQSNLQLKSFTLKCSPVPINGKWTVDFTRTNDDIKSNMTLNMAGQYDTSVFITIDTLHNSNMSDKPILHFDLRGDALSIPDLINIIKVPTSIVSKNSDALSASIKNTSRIIEYDDTSLQQENTSPPFVWIEKWVKGNGECFVGIKKLFLPCEMVLDDVECLCHMTDSRIDLKTINFLLAESPFNLNATLEHFKEKVPNPYNFALNGTFYMKNMANICRKVIPSREVIMEGTGKIDIQLTSEGVDELATIKSGHGMINVECSSGVLHLANFLDPKNRAILSALGLSSEFFSQVDNRIAYVNSFIEELQQLPYDTIKMSLQRDKNLDIIIDEMKMIGPTAHLSAYGVIPYIRHKRFYDSPLSIDVQMNVAGRLGEILDYLGLITDKPKNSRYMQGPRLKIKGTLAAPNFSDFTKILCPLF
ncbi:MAG: hypothetical protein LBB16_03525 [Puniceicoccales bacterium]|nr:hypothetical protein [Puniceicoccales bacterium]